MGSHKESLHSDMSKLQLCASMWTNFKNTVLSKRKPAIEKYIQYHSTYHNIFFSCTDAGGKHFKEKQGVGWHKHQKGKRYKWQEHEKTLAISWFK